MYIPVKLYSEKNAVLTHSGELSALGRKALIITGKNSARKSGVLDDIITALEKEDREYTIFSEVEENPSVETVTKAASFGISEKADFVIGAGGGSPLDAAKSVAFLMKGHTPEQLYSGSDDLHLPLALIPTTCGTGSEVTPYSVLTRHEKRTKKSISHKIFADIALVDGKYLAAAPDKIIKSTAMDALSHMIESYINTRADEYSRMFVSHGLELWRKNMIGEKEMDPQQMMDCSAIAGLAITLTSTGIPHGLSYSLTYDNGIPHGMAVGYFLAGFLARSPEELRNNILEKLRLSSPEELDDLYRSFSGDLSVPRETLEEAAARLWENSSKLATAPFDIDYETLRSIVFYHTDR